MSTAATVVASFCPEIGHSHCKHPLNIDVFRLHHVATVTTGLKNSLCELANRAGIWGLSRFLATDAALCYAGTGLLSIDMCLSHELFVVYFLGHSVPPSFKGKMDS